MGRGVFFVKKGGKWGVFCKKMENRFFCKKWTFPQRRVHYVQYQYFLFYTLLIWGGGAYAPPCLRACSVSHWTLYSGTEPQPPATVSLYSTHPDFGWRNSLPSLSVPFPPSVPLRSKPPLRLRGLGKRISSSSGSGRSAAAKRILVHFRHKFAQF